MYILVNVQYRFKDNQGRDKIVMPDASINCRTKSRRGNTFTDAPRFVMEVLSPQQKIMTEQRKCSCIVSRRLKNIGLLTGVKEQLKFMSWTMRERLQNTYLLKTITEENKDELQLLHFPKIKITFDELFDEID